MRGRPERGKRHNNSNRWEGGKVGGCKSGGITLTRGEEEQPEKRPMAERSDTEAEAAGREAGPSQSHYKKVHMTNIFLTDSDEKAIKDFVRDYKELYDNTSENFKDKASKECPWEQITKSHKLSVKVCKTWFDSQRTRYGNLMQLKS